MQLQQELEEIQQLQIQALPLPELAKTLAQKGRTWRVGLPALKTRTMACRGQCQVYCAKILLCPRHLPTAAHVSVPWPLSQARAWFLLEKNHLTKECDARRGAAGLLLPLEARALVPGHHFPNPQRLLVVHWLPLRLCCLRPPTRTPHVPVVPVDPSWFQALLASHTCLLLEAHEPWLLE